jgi:hypothetical protein
MIRVCHSPMNIPALSIKIVVCDTSRIESEEAEFMVINFCFLGSDGAAGS